MFKNMKRTNKVLSNEKIRDILATSEYGVLGTIGENDYPYTVPLNYVFVDNAIYFHCAQEGHKLDNIRFNPKVSFNIVSNSEIVSDEFTSKYQSVQVFGTANWVDSEEKKQALLEIIKKYSPDFLIEGKKYIDASIDKTTVIKLTIDHLTGKGNLKD